MRRQHAIVIGAGPAGLTAAYELATRTEIEPVVIEMSDVVGGISRTVNYKGNRIDIGGHRFFSKSDRVMQWWTRMLPVQKLGGSETTVSYQGRTRDPDASPAGADPEKTGQVMLLRSRKSRIYYLRKFFDYPIRLDKSTVRNLGLRRIMRIGLSYLKARLLPIRDEKSLEDFLVNRFGRELYQTFFKAYTEKVWGVPCGQISASWGVQRIKGLSVGKAISHALGRAFRKRKDVGQKKVETSLVERFLYPKFGPGQMWETCAKRIVESGGRIHLNLRAHTIVARENRVTTVVASDQATGEDTVFQGDYFFSTMPVKDLIAGLDADVPGHVREIGRGLVYRDFITVGLLLRRLRLQGQTEAAKNLSDNWIYIQEPDVRVGRLQIFNNWSPYLVADPANVWLGLEYFCDQTDDLWKLSDAEMAELGIQELAKIGFIDPADVLDWTVIRMPKTYPAYFGSYERFDQLRSWLDPLENLFLIGRNGMHRYNNQDHSMLTAMVAVDNIIHGRRDKSNIWDVNTEQDYYERKSF